MASLHEGWTLNCPVRAVPCTPRARGTVPGWRMWCGIRKRQVWVPHGVGDHGDPVTPQRKNPGIFPSVQLLFTSGPSPVGWWHRPSLDDGDWEQFVCSLWEAAGPGSAGPAVPFVLPAQLEGWDRPRGTQPVLAPPRALSQPELLLLGSCGASCANPLPLGLLGHEGGRGSGWFPQLRQEPPSQTLPWEKDSAPKFSAGCLCEYLPLLLLCFPGEDLGCAGIRGEEQGGTCRRRSRSLPDTKSTREWDDEEQWIWQISACISIPIIIHMQFSQPCQGEFSCWI